MQNHEHDHLFKILLTGDSGTGKSALLSRFSENDFTDRYISTIGVDFKMKYITIDKSKIKLQIWDTAGQERFRTITSSYYRGVHGIIVVYDVTNALSFANVRHWINEVDRYASGNVEKLLIGTKSDLTVDRVIDYNTGKELADSYNMRFMETSAKDDKNVNEAFSMLATKLKETIDKSKQTVSNSVNIKQNENVNINKSIKLNKKECCS